MGTEIRQFNITGHVSRHNSPQDKVDDALWDLLEAKVNQMIEEPLFDSLRLERTR